MEASVSADVVEALTQRFGPVTPAGAGAWSTAFRFQREGQDLVVRVGEHVSDFSVDAEMAMYAADGLPIPQVLEVSRLDPPHDHLHLCVSTFAAGRPLEEASSEQWQVLVPTVAGLLEAMRAVEPTAGSAVPTWPEVLLHRDEADGRLDRWQDRLEAQPDQFAMYRRAMSRLGELCALPPVANVAPTLLHCDLINRNVHVADGAISGVFDWGCRRWGDHLYDLAWFQFWAPWYPRIDVGLLSSELEDRWGAAPDPDRMAACLVHIGADHVVYNAVIGDPEEGSAVIDRLVALDLID